MPEEEPSIVDRLADPESLLGMLQRGRGKGYLLALETPPEQVWPLLIECVTNDPRLDKQLEEREAFYAPLISATGMGLEALRSHLKDHDSTDERPDWMLGARAMGIIELGITLTTLAFLAESGNGEAIAILREYVAYGRRWPQVVQELHAAEVLDGIDEAIYRRIRSDQDVRTRFVKKVKEDWDWYCRHDEETRPGSGLLLPICEPWKTFCEKNPDLAGCFARIGINYDHPPAPPEKMTEAEVKALSLDGMFACVDGSTKARFAWFLPEKVSAGDEELLLKHASSHDKYRMMLAFRGLGHVGTQKAFEVLKSYIEAAENADRDVRSYAYHAVETLPPELTLETARVWFQSDQHHLQIPAGGILAQHATLDDVPMLIEALRTPETIRCEDFRLYDTLSALALFDGIGPIPELETVFCEVACCFYRYDAAVAMDVTAPVHFQSEYAFECLWDCHHETRALGCKTVPLAIPRVLGRLQELAADENESDDVREAAQARIEGF